jgi:hypothetical protein
MKNKKFMCEQKLKAIRPKKNVFLPVKEITPVTSEPEIEENEIKEDLESEVQVIQKDTTGESRQKSTKEPNPSSFKEVLEEINNHPEKYTVHTPLEESAPKDRISESTSFKIVDEFAKANLCGFHLALVGISRLVQEGGTNTSKYTLKRTVEGVNFDIAVLRTPRAKTSLKQGRSDN